MSRVLCSELRKNQIVYHCQVQKKWLRRLVDRSQVNLYLIIKSLSPCGTMAVSRIPAVYFTLPLKAVSMFFIYFEVYRFN